MEKNNEINQEIDLIYLFRKIKELFFNIGLLIYKTILLIKKNIIIICALILIGYLLGYFIQKVFLSKENSELVVAPNFNSVDYLYKEVEILNSTKQNVKELKNLVKISVKPIYDFDNLIISNSSSGEQKQLFLNSYFENSNKIKKEMLDENLKSLYKNHIISFETKNVESSQLISDYILKRLNSNSYFNQKKEFEQKNLIEQKKQLLESITQINNLLNNLSDNTSLKDEKGVSINTYNELSKLVDTKNQYVNKLSEVDTDILQSKSTIYLLKKSLNIEKSSTLSTNYKLIFPILFLVFFFLFKYYLFLKNKYHQYV